MGLGEQGQEAAGTRQEEGARSCFVDGSEKDAPVNGEQWALVIFGALLSFISGGMLWIASSMRADIKKLNETVINLIQQMMPRVEAEQKRIESDRRLHNRIDRVEDRIWGEHTDPGLGGRTR